MKMCKLSICIPTFNRYDCLNNCLNSILIAKNNYDYEFEVCISDNCSKKNIEPLIKKYKNYFDIKFNKNESNLGLGVNILKAVSLADGEFVSRADAVLGAGILSGADPKSFKGMRKAGADFFYNQQKQLKRIYDLVDGSKKN